MNFWHAVLSSKVSSQEKFTESAHLRKNFITVILLLTGSSASFFFSYLILRRTKFYPTIFFCLSWTIENIAPIRDRALLYPCPVTTSATNATTTPTLVPLPSLEDILQIRSLPCSSFVSFSIEIILETSFFDRVFLQGNCTS